MRTLLTIILLGSVLLPVWAVAETAAAEPAVSITLGSRHGHVTPIRRGFTHTGGGNIDVAQPTPEAVVVTMTGVAVAGGHPGKDSAACLQFDLDQCFEVTFNDSKLKKAKLTLEGRVIGLLRSHKKSAAAADHTAATAAVTSGSLEILMLAVPPHSVTCAENLSVNCRQGSVGVQVVPGQYTLHQTFRITASHPRCLLACKAVSAEFAPDPALDPLWISYWEPFHGVNKKDFGFQAVLKVVPDIESKDKADK